MKSASLLLCVLTATVPLSAQPSDPALAVGTRHVLQSEILGEDREILVYLPASYTDSSFAVMAYPVIYMLDGDTHFHSATGVLRFLSEGDNGVVAVPEHILVAIPNTDRRRDLTPTHSLIDYLGEIQEGYQTTGGGDNFLDFMEQELFPFVESTYRTRPYRTFVGHSFGGLLVLHAFVHREDFFDGHIAIDPSLWRNGGRLVVEFEEKVASGWTRAGSVYISNAALPLLVDGVDAMRVQGERFDRSMERLSGGAFRGRYEVIPDEYHASVALLSLYYGLYHVFEGYRLIETDFLQGRDFIQNHIARFSDKLGMEFFVSPTSLDWSAGWMIERDRLRGTGLELLELNVAQFPESARTHASLARGLLVAGDTTAAIQHLGHSLGLRENAEIRRLLESLSRE